MLSLDKLAARENTTTITLRGEEVAVRGLTIAERALIDDIYLLPGRPKEDATEAELVAYKRGVNTCVAGRMAAAAAVALDWTIEGGKTWADVRDDTGLAKQFLKRCGEEFVTANLSRAELDAVLEAVERVEKPAAATAETARKN